MVRAYLDGGGTFPYNLNVRLSAAFAGRTCAPLPGTTTSSVDADGQRCPARNQGNECRDCRACWDRDVQNVDYPKH